MNNTILCIIDGSSLLFRSYYGVRPLHTSSGKPTHAIYGFCRTLKKIIDSLHPTHIALVWDVKGPTFRHKQYEQYKATRQAPPSDLITQKDAIMQFAELVGVRQVFKQGFEADDLIYSLAKDKLADSVVVITGDKDLHQLLSLGVTIFDPFKQKNITHESFIEERGFEPDHLMLYHSLLGDSSDNIPGVKGVGKKTAESLTKQFGTLDNMYAHLDDVTPPRVAKLLTEHKNDAFLSSKLFELRYEDTGLSLDDCAHDSNAWVHARPFFNTHEITPFTPKGVTAHAPAVQKAGGGQQQSIFGGTADVGTGASPARRSPSSNTPSHDPLGRHAGSEAGIHPHQAWTPHLVTTQQQLDDLIAKLQSAKIIAVDTETNSLTPFRDEVVGISCAVDDADCHYIPFGHTTGESQLERDVVLNAFRPILENTSLPKVLHNAKFDQAGFARYGIQVAGIADDTLIMACLLRKGSESIGLKALSMRYLGEEMGSYKDVAKGKKTFADVPLKQALEYAAHDARQTLLLQRILRAELEKHPELLALYTDIEMPLSHILWDMEHTGISLNTHYLQKLAAQVETELETIVHKIDTCLHAGQQRIDATTINLNSPQQLEVLLFDKLKLPSIKKNKKTGSRSTDSEVLSELSKLHPVPGLIIKYREMTKLLNTYLAPLPDEINPRTNRVHTTYSQTITATGRLSSAHPNLQNIPVGGGYGSKVRHAFVAPKGCVFLSADYSQIELRILGQFSKDPELLDAFKHDKDIHTKTSALIFNVSEKEVTPEQRQVGKRINFSIMYGLTPFGLSKDLGIPPKEAKEYIESYFAQYAGVHNWMEQIVAQAKEDGYVSTLLGRRRYTPGLHERNRNIYEAERRVTINTPIQGTSADLIKLAMLRINKQLHTKGLKARMVLQIHDELVLSVPHEEVAVVTQLVDECMTSVVTGWDVPLTVSTRTGDNWGAANK